MAGTERNGKEKKNEKRWEKTQKIQARIATSYEVGKQRLNVINLSAGSLSDSDVSLLSKGLNFCPSHHFDLFSTILDVNKLASTLTLQKHYFSEEKNVSSSSSDITPSGESTFSPLLFLDVCAHIDLTDLAYESSIDIDNGSFIPNPVLLKTRSDFYPINSRGRNMDSYQKLVERDLASLAKTISHKSTSNLNSKEKTSLHEL